MSQSNSRRHQRGIFDQMRGAPDDPRKIGYSTICRLQWRCFDSLFQFLQAVVDGCEDTLPPEIYRIFAEAETRYIDWHAAAQDWQFYATLERREQQRQHPNRPQRRGDFPQGKSTRNAPQPAPLKIPTRAELAAIGREFAQLRHEVNLTTAAEIRRGAETDR